MLTGTYDDPGEVYLTSVGVPRFSEPAADISKARHQLPEPDHQCRVTNAAALCVDMLTERQHQIMDLIVAGEPSKNIAADLGISQRTVESHRAAIMKKTGSKSIPALARLAFMSAMNGPSLVNFAQKANMPTMEHGKISPPIQQQAAEMDRRMTSIGQSDILAMTSDPANPYSASELEMYRKMIRAKVGLPSELWTRKMIEHHRGAIGMSRVALEKATDKQTQKMAQMTITAQTRVIAKLQAWLKCHGKAAQ